MHLDLRGRISVVIGMPKIPYSTTSGPSLVGGEPFG